MSKIPEVVFDTQIFLRALINKKSACGRLVFNMQADYQLYTTEPINAEIMDVLTRSSIRAKFPQITDASVVLIQDALGLANFIDVKPEDVERICRDPKDDIFLACAKVAGAEYLMSEDNDLLVLGQHHMTKIVRVSQFIEILEQSQAESSSSEGVDPNRVDE